MNLRYGKLFQSESIAKLNHPNAVPQRMVIIHKTAL